MLSASYVSLVESGRPPAGDLRAQPHRDRLGVDTGYLRDGIDAEVRRRAGSRSAGPRPHLSRGEVDDAYPRFAG